MNLNEMVQQNLKNYEKLSFALDLLRIALHLDKHAPG